MPPKRTRQEVKSTYNYDYYRTNRNKFRWNAIKLKYGLDEAGYNKMLTDQNFGCAICGKHISNCARSLYIDHCHETGTVRGLLCCPCNSGIGLMNDNIETLEKAIEYLK